MQLKFNYSHCFYIQIFRLGWLVFDITEAVKIWQKFWMRNNGLLLTVTGANKEPIRPFLVGLSSSNNASPNQEVRNFSYCKSIVQSLNYSMTTDGINIFSCELSPNI